MSGFAAACYGKQRFGSWNAAVRVQSRGQKRRVKGYETQEPYRCKFCAVWHLGTPSSGELPKRDFKRFKERYEGTNDWS